MDSPLTVGTIYMLVGGKILRYQGPYTPPPGKAPGPGLAFRAPSDGVQEPAVGYSASLSEVLRPLGPADLPMLRTRCEQARARNLMGLVEETEFVIKEFGG
jgi:hypothetical protein